MKTSFIKYIALFFLLAAMLESSHIPVISVFGKQISTGFKVDDNSTEDPVKETENLRNETVKDYLHLLTWFNFSEPVFLLPAKQWVVLKTKFPYSYYPEVPTPPPTC